MKLCNLVLCKDLKIFLSRFFHFIINNKIVSNIFNKFYSFNLLHKLAIFLDFKKIFSKNYTLSDALTF
jgi:hypothetical protein